jgi:hypothetical protein
MYELVELLEQTGYDRVIANTRIADDVKVLCRQDPKAISVRGPSFLLLGMSWLSDEFFGPSLGNRR